MKVKILLKIIVYFILNEISDYIFSKTDKAGYMLKYYFSTYLIFLNIWLEILKTILMNGEVESVKKIPDLLKIIAQAEEYLLQN